jgi:hypothetical protein
MYLKGAGCNFMEDFTRVSASSLGSSVWLKTKCTVDSLVKENISANRSEPSAYRLLPEKSKYRTSNAYNFAILERIIYAVAVNYIASFVYCSMGNYSDRDELEEWLNGDVEPD